MSNLYRLCPVKKQCEEKLKRVHNLCRKTYRKQPLGKPSCGRQDNIYMDLKKEWDARMWLKIGASGGLLCARQ
jgi:hypothetical protein